MKHHESPLFRVACYICGQEGWNLNATDAWLGARFYCREGCDPAAVRAHVKKKLEAEAKQQEKKDVESVGNQDASSQ